MIDDDSEHDRKKQSLLSLGAAEADAPRPRGGSLLSAAPKSEDDPVARHRAARSKREAPSPLLEALAAIEGFKATPGGTIEPEAGAAPVAEEGQSRWSLRNLLSPKVKFEPPAPDAGEPPRSREEPITAPADEPAPAAPAKADTADRPVAEEGSAGTETGTFSDEDPRWQPLIDPLRVIGGIGNSISLIVAMTLIGAAIGVAVALSTPKKYEAVAKLLVDPRDFKVSDRDLTESGLPQDATLALIENQVEIITSSAVLNAVVKNLKLDEDPEFNGEGSGGGIGDIIGGLRALLSGGQSGSEDRRHALAVASLGESLNVERDEQRFTVTVKARTEDPDKSARIVNEVDHAYIARKAELQKETVGRAADELSSGLGELRAELEKAERASEKFRAEHDLIDAQGRLISDDELVKLNEQLTDIRAHKIDLNARAESARAVKIDAVIASGLPEELTSTVMSELRSQYAAIKQQADQLSVQVGPLHPQYLAMQAQLDGARAQIAAELQRIVLSVQTELRRAVQQEQDLAARLAQLKVRATDVNADLITLRQLEREAAAKRSVYENYLLRAKEASEQSGIDTANVTVISSADPPLESTGPSRAVIAAGGAVLGLLAGIGLGMLRGIFSSLRDRSRADSRRRVSLSTRVATAPTAAVVIEEQDGAPTVETAALAAASTAPPAEATTPVAETDAKTAEARAPADTLRQARIDAARKAVAAVRVQVEAARVTDEEQRPDQPAKRPVPAAVVDVPELDRLDDWPAARSSSERPLTMASMAQPNARTEAEEAAAAASVAGAWGQAEEIAVPVERQAADAVPARPAREEEPAMNPLVRLMQRMRPPAVVVGKRNSATDPANSPAHDMPANEDRGPMNPYPQPPYGEPQQAPGHPQQAAYLYPTQPLAPQVPAYPQPPQAYPQPVQAYPPQVHAYPQAAASYAQAPAYAPPAPHLQSYQAQQPLPPYAPGYAQPPQYAAPQPPQYAAQQPAGYPYPQAPQPAPHGWQPQPQPVSPYGYPQPAAQYPAYPPAPQQPSAHPQAHIDPARPEARAEPREMSPIEEVRESLREFRDAIRDLAADRARRRYS